MKSGVVRVRSRTDPEKVYTLLVGPTGEATCTCAGYEHRGSCWHLKYLREERALNEESSTALVPIEVRPPTSVLPTRAELSIIGTVAKTVVAARGHAVPKEIDSPAKAAAVMLAGWELGVRPMTALELESWLEEDRGVGPPEDKTRIAALIGRSINSEIGLCEHVVRWDGVTRGGEPVPCTAETRRELFERQHETRTAIVNRLLAPFIARIARSKVSPGGSDSASPTPG